MERLRRLAPEPPWTYLATGEPGDDEMRARISRHQAERGAGWHTVEAPRAPRLVGDAVLLDCLTLWISNRLHDGAADQEIVAEAGELAESARALPAVVMVTNEVGGGTVPDHPLARRFRD